MQLVPIMAVGDPIVEHDRVTAWLRVWTLVQQVSDRVDYPDFADTELLVQLRQRPRQIAADPFGWHRHWYCHDRVSKSPWYSHATPVRTIEFAEAANRRHNNAKTSLVYLADSLILLLTRAISGYTL